MYLQKGWTVVEDNCGGYTAYWLVTPHGKDTKSFASKLRAYEYWKANKKKMENLVVNLAKQAAESFGINWSKLSAKERETWEIMSRSPRQKFNL
jgi:hypothetical protein